MRANHIIDLALKRHWTDEVIEKYIGRYESGWLMHATDAKIRSNAASGGTITALLTYLLESGEVDGVLVLKSFVEANEVYAKYEIATSREMLVRAQGSKYLTTNFGRDAVPLIKSFSGKLAVVLLPCDSWIVNRLRISNQEIMQKIRLRITLFCGHISDPGLTREIIRKQKMRGVSLTNFRYRRGHWRGKTQLDFEDGTSFEMPFSGFSDYQNLYFYCAQKCLRCHDHTGYDSDIAVGDIWLMSMKDDPIKQNAVIVRNAFAEQLLLDARNAGWLTGKSVPMELIADAQSRSLPLHYNVSARSIAGKLLGINITAPRQERVRPVDFLVAFLILLNFRLTTSAAGRELLRYTPRILVKFYLYFLKALEIW